ncbi:dipeptidyl aminopeptidase 3 [Plasmodium sp. gorilla clade G2]|uniref:dipeptidyl aminopeptidase 3 n=1 Tax=Plasmodium sp. gorilla clade G2 TaxID=880535 RepID=UPI000D20D49E|nr:dipeptidyl aminopeptidase 3 [Plasmodium sp. gorilla clade G2]SOV11174.1 dipeptidyl aminopeptidase 3 [Plasmodium sp. gorilla clade G2]
MILIFSFCLINILFLNFIKCDIPVHCLSRHVEGKWEIHLGLLKKKKNSKQKSIEGVTWNDGVARNIMEDKQKGNHNNDNNNNKNNDDNNDDDNNDDDNNDDDDDNYDYQCGYKRPDNADYHDDLNPENEDTKKRFEEKDKRFIVFNKDRSLNILKENEEINYTYSGHWKIIYDEGLYIEVYKENESKEVYFSFFKFKQIGDISYSYCNSLIMGVVNKYSLDNNIWNMSYEENIEENITSDDKNNNIHFFQDEKKSIFNINDNNKEINTNISHIYMLRKNVTFFKIKNNKTNKPKRKGKRKKIKENIIITKGSSNNNNTNLIPNDDNYNKMVKEKNFFELIDYYNDNYINSDHLQMQKYCWYAKKVEKNSEQPTNKIPIQSISPLSVNADEYNKLYNEKKKNNIIKKHENNNVSILNDDNNLQDNIIHLRRDKNMITKYKTGLLIMNNNNKYEKKNSLFYKYKDKNINLKNFNWYNKEDIKMRLGLYIKILDDAIDQKDCGSCYANSAAFIINSRVRIKYNYIKNIDSLFFSNEQLIFCDIFNQGCNGGYIYLSLKYAYENFLYTQKCFQKYKNKNIYNTKRDDSEYYNELHNADDNSLLCDTFNLFKMKHEQNKLNKIKIKQQISMDTTNDSNNEEEYKEKNDDNGHLLLLSSSSYEVKDDNKKKNKINNIQTNNIMNNNNNNNHNNNNNNSSSNISEDVLNENYILMDQYQYNNNIDTYDISKLNSCDVKINISKFEYLDIQNEEELKKYIYYNGPVAAAIEPSTEFIGYKKGIISGNYIKMQDGNKNNAYIWNKVDHAVVIVGWGEDTFHNFIKKNNLSKEQIKNISTIIEKNKNNNNNDNNNNDNIIKYWKVLNSWGVKWGNKGYFYILRNNNSFNIKSYILACDVNLFVKQQ